MNAPTSKSNPFAYNGYHVPRWDGKKRELEPAVSIFEGKPSKAQTPRTRLRNNVERLHKTTCNDVSEYVEILRSLNNYSSYDIEADLAYIYMADDIAFEMDGIDQMAEIDLQIASLNAVEYPHFSFAAPGIIRDPIFHHMDVNSAGVIAIALGPQLWLFFKGHPPRLVMQSTSSYFTSVSWCPESSSRFAAGSSDGSVMICYGDSERRRIQAHSSGHVSSVAWRNEHCLTSGGSNGSIVHVDTRTEQTSQEHVYHKGEVCCLKWDPEGSFLASGGTDNSLLIWDASDGPTRSVVNFEEPDAPAVQAVSWSRSERGLLAFGGGHNGSHIRFINAFADDCELGSVDTGSSITSLAWNGECIVSSHVSSHICSWSYPSKSFLKEYVGHSASVLHVGIADDSTILFAVGSDEIVNLWKL